MAHRRLLVLFTLLSTGTHAQWLNYPTPGTPRTRDGKPNLAAPAPRAANAKLDLSGAWYVQPTSLAEWKVVLGDRFDAQFKARSVGMELDHISKYSVNILADFKTEEVPMRPEAAEILRRRAPGDLPQTNCLPIGIPADGLFSPPIKIVQSPGVIVILYENDGRYRQIYTDGRTLPKEVVQPAWLGYSVGKWERDTLAVETAGFNDRTWLDLMGHPRSEALRVVERYRRRDFGHMDAEMTFDDPQMYTKPFTIKVTYELLADSDIFEFVCNENEKDRPHLQKQ
ncbi:MAG TPA: hypothetical protein VGR73_10455 [Bryobacteraceae bacterium]|nr:hypothetical protein [Bryobacteraceae bacterium]